MARDRERSRSKEREVRRRDRSPSPNYRRREKVVDEPRRGDRRRSPPHRESRRSRSPRDYKSKERRSRSRSPRREREKDKKNKRDKSPPKIDLESLATAEEDMMKMMGFGGFDTTKNKKVEGNIDGLSKVNKPRKFRQYMNRKGGFNRPLDYIS